MRFVTFRRAGKLGLAVESGGRLHGCVESDLRYPGGLLELIRVGNGALVAAHGVLSRASEVRREEIEYLPPILVPGKIICVGLNYRDHSEESGHAQPEYPTLFPRFSSSIVGHQAKLVRPAISDSLDYEGELVAVVGRRARHVPHGAALKYIAGYSLFNDGSVREYQFKAPQWTIGKNFDDSGSFGPAFVSADELPLGAAGLRIETRLNGKLVQSANTDQLVFGVGELLATISEAITLMPGDLIVTGTPAGVGHARTPKRYMRAGDVCEVEIEQLGVLRNTVADEPPPSVRR